MPDVTRRPLAAALLGTVPPGAGAHAAEPRRRAIHPTGASYAMAHLVERPSRLLFISGQVPTDATGETPADFASQARLCWRNVEARLEAAAMSLDDLVKVTIFLSDRAHRAQNTEVRRDVLGERSPALTVIITGIFDEAWLLEIEAIAAR